jgi:hypothetical protein
VVVLGVDKADVEAAGVEQLGHVEHRGDVPLRRVRQAHGVRLLDLGHSGCDDSDSSHRTHCHYRMCTFRAEMARAPMRVLCHLRLVVTLVVFLGDRITLVVM